MHLEEYIGKVDEAPTRRKAAQASDAMIDTGRDLVIGALRVTLFEHISM